MNEHPLPPDELASALLDDELGDAEAAEVRSDPAAAARAEALRRATEAVGEAVSPPPGAEDAAVAAALADFDARRVASLDTARRHPRGLRVITSVAAAVAVGFIVAAAIGLFAEREGADSDTVSMAAAPAPAPAPEASPADEASAAAAETPPPAEPAPPPADDAPEAAAEMAPSEPATDASPMPSPVDGAAPAEAQEEAEAARATAAAAQAGAAAAQAEAEAAAAPPPAVTAPPRPAGEPLAMEDSAIEDGDVARTAGAGEQCVAALGDRTVALRLPVDGNHILVIETPDGELAALDGTTCAEIPPDDPAETTADPSPALCAEIRGAAIDLQITVADNRIVVLRTSGGELTALDGTTCAPFLP